MINNTNFDRWNRLQAKSLDSQFKNEMITGLNCSPFEAEAILEKVHEVYRPLMEINQGLRPGQIQHMVVDASVAPNIPLATARQRLVTPPLAGDAIASRILFPSVGVSPLSFKRTGLPVSPGKQSCRASSPG